MDARFGIPQGEGSPRPRWGVRLIPLLSGSQNKPPLLPSNIALAPEPCRPTPSFSRPSKRCISTSSRCAESDPRFVTIFHILHPCNPLLDMFSLFGRADWQQEVGLHPLVASADFPFQPDFFNAPARVCSHKKEQQTARMCGEAGREGGGSRAQPTKIKIAILQHPSLTFFLAQSPLFIRKLF